MWSLRSLLHSRAVGVPVEKFKMFTDGIKTLPPGKRYHALFDIGFQRVQSNLPLTCSVTIRYYDEAGRRPFEDILDLDLELYMHLETSARKDLHDVNERLKEISATLGKWSWNGGGGLLTVSRQEADERAQARRAEIEARRRGQSDQ